MQNPRVSPWAREVGGDGGGQRESGQQHESSTDAGYLYLIGRPDLSLVKVGRTRDPAHRFKALQTGCPDALTIIYAGRDLGMHERTLHRFLREDRVRGEWFKGSGLMHVALQALRASPIKAPYNLFRSASWRRDARFRLMMTLIGYRKPKLTEEAYWHVLHCQECQRIALACMHGGDPGTGEPAQVAPSPSAARNGR